MGWNGPIYGVIHATAAPNATARSVFNDFMGSRGACSHFVIGKAGDIYQCADPNWAASANCCPTAPSPFVNYFHGINSNFGTWSIEILKNGINNEDILSEAQFQSVVSVSDWLCKICNTKRVWCTDSSGGITSHSYMDPVHRPGNHDPGPFDWDRYFALLQGRTNIKGMEKQFEIAWAQGAADHGIKTWDSGIKGAAKACFLANKMSATFPITNEQTNQVDWGENPCVIQYLANGCYVVWQNAHGRVYNSVNTLIWG